MHYKRLFTACIIFGIAFISILTLGTFMYRSLEGWSLVDSLYFTVTVVTTMGFGDLTPSHDVSKIATVIYSLVSIPLTLLMFTYLAREYLDDRISSLEQRISRQLTHEDKEIEEIEAIVKKKK